MLEPAVYLHNLLVLEFSFYIVLFRSVGVVDWLVSSHEFRSFLLFFGSVS